MKVFGAIVAGLALTVGVAVGGWQLGWWMQSAGTNRAAHIYQHSYGAQTADLDQIEQGIRDVATIDGQVADPSTPNSEVPSLRAQQRAVINQICDVAARVTSPLPSDAASFVSTNCEGLPQ